MGRVPDYSNLILIRAAVSRKLSAVFIVSTCIVGSADSYNVYRSPTLFSIPPGNEKRCTN